MAYFLTARCRTSCRSLSIGVQRMKWIVGGVAIVLVMVPLVSMINISFRDDRPQKEITKSSKSRVVIAEDLIDSPVEKRKSVVTNATSGVEGDLKDAGISYSQTTALPREIVSPHSIQSALDSMRDGLAEGDARTPLLSEPVEYEQPTLDELNDPVLYQQYEKHQSLNQASAYFSAAVKELPVLRAKIAQARQNGTQTEDEIQEAEEALQKLELMQLEYQWQMPEAAKADIPQ